MRQGSLFLPRNWSWKNGSDGRRCTCRCRSLKTRRACLDIFGHRQSRKLSKFYRKHGFDVKEELRYRDHHLYSRNDLDDIMRRCSAVGAQVAVCTEKDVYNLPRDGKASFPVFIPSVMTTVDDGANFFAALTKALRPKIVISSNGHGEDSMACMLADRLKRDLPKAQIYAFPLVGRARSLRMQE